MEERILDALSEGKLVVAIMGKGHFTNSGYFIVLRGVSDGQILAVIFGLRSFICPLSKAVSEAERDAGENVKIVPADKDSIMS